MRLSAPYLAVALIVAAVRFPAADADEFSDPFQNSTERCLWRDPTTVECHMMSQDTYPEQWTLESEFKELLAGKDLRKLVIVCCDDFPYQNEVHFASGQVLRDLTELIIIKCRLTKGKTSYFQDLPSLRHLTLSSTNWDASSLLTVSILPHTVESLNLTNNAIWRLPPMVFCSMDDLQTLNLSNNKLHSVKEIGFFKVSLDNKVNTNVKEAMTVQNSSYSPSQDLNLWRKCGKRLQELDLNNNEIVRLPPSGFSQLDMIKNLYLSGNGIRIITKQAFNNLYSLKILDLSNNHIVALYNGTFEHNNGLEKLILRNNSIGVFGQDLFANLAQLQLMDASYNGLEFDIESGSIFGNLKRLVILNLSHNNVSNLKAEMFTGLSSLQKLDLSYNKISSLNESEFIKLSNLYKLDLSFNKLSQLEKNSFSGLVGLTQLEISSNDLKHLDKNVFEKLSNLKDINLSWNNLEEIPSAVISLSFLKHLDLSHNKILILNSFQYSDLNNLITLNLQFNRIRHLGNHTLRGLTILNVLNLCSNDIKTIDENTFDSTSSLNVLDLSNNKIRDINGLFAGVESLKTLDLSRNSIHMFDYAFLPRQLINLNITKNKIQQLGNYFKVHNVLSLENIDTSHNLIEKIYEFSLPNSVKNVLLHHNEIQLVEAGAFGDKVNLTFLDISENRLEKLNKKSITPKQNFFHSRKFELKMTGNLFTCDCDMQWLFSTVHKASREAIPQNHQEPLLIDVSDIYCKLPHQRNNRTSVVKIVDTVPEDFLCPYASHCFALCHCCAFIACDCQMQCPQNCLCYHDDTWVINIVDCSNGNLNRLPSKIPMDATIVFIDGNDLPTLHAHQFIGRHSIRRLYLNNSKIEILQNRTFHGLTSLEVLYLHDNFIAKLNGFEFFNLPQLKELHLQNNKLTYISNTTFLQLQNLKVLHLENNFIVDFPVWTLSKNAFLSRIFLSNNPWDCSCSFVELLNKWTVEQEQIIVDSEQIFCVYDKSSVGPNIATLPYSCAEGMRAIRHYHFGQKQLPFLAGGLCGAVALVISLVLVSMYVARRRMAVKSKLSLAQSSPFHDDGKIFDVYISYSAKDASFVRDVIASKLENCSPSYKTCLHSRDFTESSRLPDFIAQSIGFSRKTIIVISQFYLQNEWENCTFKKAHVDSLSSKDVEIVTIMYGTVNERSLGSELKQIVKRSTKVKWGSKNFWKKLMESMPIKVSYTGVYVSDRLYKNSSLQLLSSNLSPHQTSHSPLTGSTEFTTPSEGERHSYEESRDGPCTYKAPPPPRPCHSPPCLDYIIMQGRDCRDPNCNCLRHHNTAYTFVEGDSSSVHTYNSLQAFAHQLCHHSEANPNRTATPNSQHYSIIDSPSYFTEKPVKSYENPLIYGSYRKKQNSCQHSLINGDSLSKSLHSNSLRDSKSSHRSSEGHSDYSTDHSSDRSSGRSFEESVMNVPNKVNLIGLNTDECFV